MQLQENGKDEEMKEAFFATKIIVVAVVVINVINRHHHNHGKFPFKTLSTSSLSC